MSTGAGAADRDVTQAASPAATAQSAVAIFAVASTMLGAGVRRPTRWLCDPDERKLFICWARNVVAIYAALIALAFTALAWSPSAPSSGAPTSNAPVQATPAEIAPPQPLPPSL